MAQEVKILGRTRVAGTESIDSGNLQPVALDKFGRVLTYPYHIRGAMATAYVALTNGTKTSLLAAGGTGIYHDLVQLSCLNTTGSAITLTLLDESTTVATIKLAATSGQEHLIFPAPIPQSGANAAWYVDLPDDNNSTVYVEGIFVKNK